MADNAQTVESLIEKSRSTDIPLLLKAKEDAKRRVKEDPVAANLSGLEKAEKMLNAALAISEKTQSAIFPNIKSVLAYLHQQGRKIKKTQFYDDLKAGIVCRQPDDGFLQKDIDSFVGLLPIMSQPECIVDEQVDLARKKLEAEVAKLNEQRISIVFAREKEMGKYLLRFEVYLELAGRPMALSMNLRSMFRLHTADYIRLVNGDIGKTEELAREFETNLDSALNDYSKPMEFTLEITGENEPVNGE